MITCLTYTSYVPLTLTVSILGGYRHIYYPFSSLSISLSCTVSRRLPYRRHPFLRGRASAVYLISTYRIWTYFAVATTTKLNLPASTCSKNLQKTKYILFMTYKSINFEGKVSGRCVCDRYLHMLELL